MYQWREDKKVETNKSVGGTEEAVTTYSYKKVWSTSSINSQEFRVREGHGNPAMRYSSDSRMERYTTRTHGVRGAAELLPALRELYDEDVATGHIAAVQELVAGAVGSTRLAAGVRAEIRRWEDFTEALIARLLGDSPFAALIPGREAAMAAMAFYLGLEMLTFVEPLGPICIAACLEAEGHECKVIDLRIDGEKRGMEICRQFDPDVVGLQCNFTTERNRTLHDSEAIMRERDQAAAERDAAR